MLLAQIRSLKSSLNVRSICWVYKFLCIGGVSGLGQTYRVLFLRSVVTASATVTCSSRKSWGLNNTEGLEEKRASFILPGKTKVSLSVVLWGEREREAAKNA